AGQPNLENCPDFSDNETYVRNKIRNERAIELAYENQRYFDLKRWKMGPSHIGGPVTKMVITGTSDNPIFSKQIYEERVFTDKWYLYPLKEADVLKSFGILLQNPGW
ncbi:MAG: RagB/SusD family nutrient uptake outer membrane protein, partial [Bacteroidales bacterium]